MADFTPLPILHGGIPSLTGKTVVPRMCTSSGTIENAWHQMKAHIRKNVKPRNQDQLAEAVSRPGTRSPILPVPKAPCPKPKTRLEACMRWIKACGRPHWQLNVGKITKDTYVCSKEKCVALSCTEFGDETELLLVKRVRAIPTIHKGVQIQILMEPLWEFVCAFATPGKVDKFITEYRKDESINQAIALKYRGFLSGRKYNVQCRTLTSFFDPNKKVWLPRSVKVDGVDVRSMRQLSHYKLDSVEETDAVMADLWQQHTEEMTPNGKRRPSFEEEETKRRKILQGDEIKQTKMRNNRDVPVTLSNG
ncbi:hypothetical protein Bbelb_374390 [Branchiostoma belcheri]|nr:hypothetical protein Bbelb_374390 [Branchiostoma belcheri]